MSEQESMPLRNIRTVRKQQKMTLAQVAEVTGLSISFLSDLERGRTNPSLSTLKRLAACYGVQVAYLLEEMGETMRMKRVPVTEFFVSPSILFKCLFCGVANESRRNGPFHASTGDHCKNCGAYYAIQWHDNAEQSTIEMTWPDEQEEDQS